MSYGEQLNTDERMIERPYLMENIADNVLMAVDSSEIASDSEKSILAANPPSVYSKLGHLPEASRRIVLDILSGRPIDSTDHRATRIAQASLVGTLELEQQEVLASFQRINEAVSNEPEFKDETDNIKISNCYAALHEIITSPERSFSHPLAACVGLPPDWFFPAKGEITSETKRVCFNCPVKDPCLDFALEKKITMGIWGGLTNYAREELRNEQNKQQAS